MIHQMMEHSVRCPADMVKNKKQPLEKQVVVLF